MIAYGYYFCGLRSVRVSSGVVLCILGGLRYNEKTLVLVRFHAVSIFEVLHESSVSCLDFLDEGCKCLRLCIADDLPTRVRQVPFDELAETCSTSPPAGQ